MRIDKSMGTLPDPLPWATIAGPWGYAEESLARLDQTLAMSEVRDAWVAQGIESGRGPMILSSLRCFRITELNRQLGWITAGSV
jgi:hypothetical protein